MAMLEPDFAVLDETDSGLDIDALGDVARGITEVRAERPALGILLITHYQRILHHLTPDYVHVLLDGRGAESGKARASGRRVELSSPARRAESERARALPHPSTSPASRPTSRS